MGEMISFGAGVNSTAMTILLVNRGWRGPIVFADTGTEWPETYCFMDYFNREWLGPRGLKITRISPTEDMQPSHSFSLVEYCEKNRWLPQMATRWCTSEWKVYRLHRWAKTHGNPIQLVGIAADEAHRQKGRVCPLVDKGIDRRGCIRIIQGEGLDVPQKSGCWICPFQGKRQWHELYRRHPELFERAARLEEGATERRRVQASIHPDFTLRELEVQFRDQGAFFNDAEMDGLLEYKPCICGL